MAWMKFLLICWASAKLLHRACLSQCRRLQTVLFGERKPQVTISKNTSAVKIC